MKQIAFAAALLAALGLGGVPTVARAHAAPSDDYLHCLKSHGVDYNRPNQALWLSLGETTIKDLRSSTTPLSNWSKGW